MSKRRVNLRVYVCLALLIASFGLGGSADALVTPVVVLGVEAPTNLSQLDPFDVQDFAVNTDGSMLVTTQDRVLLADGTTGDITLVAGGNGFGFSGAGGLAVNAQIGFPARPAWDGAGNIYFASNDRVLKVTVADGILHVVAGNGGFALTPGEGDGGPATSAPLSISDLSVDNAGNVYIVEQFSQNLGAVRKVSAVDGTISNYLGGAAQPTDCQLPVGPATDLRFVHVGSVVVDGSGNLSAIVGCGAAGDEIIQVPADRSSWTLLGGGGASALGTTSSALAMRIDHAADLVLTTNGVAYLELEFTNFGQYLREISIGTVTTRSRADLCQFGSGVSLSATCVSGVAANGDHLVVRASGTGGSGLAVVGFGVLTQLTTTGAEPVDGQPATAAPLPMPMSGLAVASDGTLFYSVLTESFTVRTVSTGGVLGTKAGNGSAAAGGFGGFGGAALSAQVPPNLSISTMPDGSLILTSPDYGYIAKIAPNGTLTKIAGNGVPADGGIGANAGAISILPTDAVGVGANVYMGSNVTKTCVFGAFSNPCPSAEVRKIAANGAMTRVYTAQNDASRLTDLAVSPGGTLFFATGTGGTVVRVDPSTSGATTTTLPTNVFLGQFAVDSAGNYFGVDYLSGALWKVTAYGVATDQAPGRTFFGSAGVAIDAAGNVYVGSSTVVSKFPGLAAPAAAPKPTLTGFSPAAAQVGAAVTIKGANITGVSSVKFGAIASKAVRVTAANTITAVVPPGAVNAKITVTTVGGSVLSASSLTVLPAPTQVAAGRSHSCARLSNGSVACWGTNTAGQLGNGGTAAAATPSLVPGLAGVTQVAAGDAFSCARTAAGGVRCWGGNANGQLGRGNTLGSKTPVTVVASGATPLTGAASVSAGGNFACAVMSPGAAGTVRCWGANNLGQLGDGTTTQRVRPVAVLASAGTPLKGVVSVEAGGSSACAVLTSGAVKCWGANAHGQLGNGTTTNSRFAVTVVGLDGVKAKAQSVSVGLNHACAVSKPNVICWGANASGQLGDNTLVQRTKGVAVKQSTTLKLAGAVAVSAGDTHTCAVVGTGTTAKVWCWGDDSKGQLGNTTTGGKKVATLVAGTAASKATAVAAGALHTLVLAPSTSLTPTTIVGWGANVGRQLGDGTTVNRLTPTPNPYL